jgi:cyanoexosortase A
MALLHTGSPLSGFPGPINRRLAHLRDRLPAPIRRWLPDVPPATARNLWLLLALLVATQNVTVFHTSQSDTLAILSVVVWGGALICMEDQLDDLLPQPGFIGLFLGSALLLGVLARSAVILQADGIIFILAPLGGIALTFLCQPWRQLGRFRDSLLCLLLLPLYRFVRLILPDHSLSIITSHTAGFWLSILGLDVVVHGDSVMLPGGGVRVATVCNGIDIISQLTAIGAIFLLAFSLRSLWARIFLFLIAPLIGFLSNTIRVSLLAVLTSQGQHSGFSLFEFFHKDAGSLIFAGLAVWLYGSIYMRILERELSLHVVSQTGDDS